MKGNKLLMPFKDESPNFVHGFECGQIWEKMKKNEKFSEYLFHTINTEQVKLICQRYLYNCKIEKIDNTWSILTADVSERVN